MFIFISAVVKSYLFSCKCAGKVLDPVKCWNKMFYKDREKLTYFKNSKTTKFKARWHAFK